MAANESGIVMGSLRRRQPLAAAWEKLRNKARRKPLLQSLQ